jgi:polysaccharide pyruvyl transferase WcaK-like protein
MGPAARKHLVSVAYQGFGNVGDEAILTGVEELLKGSQFDVSTIVAGSVAPVVAFPNAVRICQRRITVSPAALARLAVSDGLLIAGGGLLHDHWVDVIPRYLAWAMSARLLRKPVVWLGVGVGPIRRAAFRRMAAAATRVSDLVLVRDRASADLLTRIGGRVDGVMPDLALFNPPAVLPVSYPGGQSPSSARPLAIIIRRPIRDDPALLRRIADELAAFAVREWRLARRPLRVLTFAGPRDIGLAHELVRVATANGHPDIAIVEVAPHPSDAISVLAASCGVVSMRLHGLLMGAMLGLPIVGIAYDDKVRAVLSELGADALIVSLRSLSVSVLVQAWERAASPDTIHAISQAVARQRARRAEILDRLSGVWS